MRRVVGLALAIVLVWAPLILPARAEQPLRLGEVLRSLQETHPSLEAAARGVDHARGKQLSASGGWDPQLEVAGRYAPVGYYDNGQLDAKVRQATPLWGASAYAGYRVGWGEYPAYKGELETLSGGELRAGLDVPFWRGGPIDPRRADVARADDLTRAAVCARKATRLALGRAAAHAYWDWVSKGRQVRVQHQLLGVAETRDAGLREQVSSGSIPSVVVIDNERLVLDRRAKLVSTERAFREAALGLSLFLRDAERRPVQVPANRIPSRLPEPPALPLSPESADVATALSARPEICALEAQRDAAGVDARLADNQLAPALNAQAFVSRDVGDGPAELAPTEFGVGFTFEMPLLLRKARGERDAAGAKVGEVTAVLRRQVDQIAAQVRQARVDLGAARAQLELARRQLEVAHALEEAEREKFRQGASSLVIVNLREIAAADAARLAVEALADAHKAHADYLAATGQGN